MPSLFQHIQSKSSKIYYTATLLQFWGKGQDFLDTILHAEYYPFCTGSFLFVLVTMFPVWLTLLLAKPLESADARPAFFSC